ncbi:MAG: hypothetical protein ABF649_21640 [Bacillus sp. (in: firmicutes)]
MELNSKQLVELTLKDGQFDPKGINISVQQNENKIDLDYQKDKQIFQLPTEKGEYMIVVEVNNDRGTAQYVGNIVIK